ncbi:hypothetical protein [Jatrophihabitans endophyticus]|uniref:hypothetical protein n=1 Tax=Jatrophihabitans endophyticus TaxID=1206085 RepID=UPI001A0D7586|nr:hypothetical protein [Jatrophihabitans endophyticus]MBE7188925.1 hypothetical protein [Jatrophihabitans endophyticus]
MFAALALAVPASIAPSSLVGAYVVLGILALAGAAAIEVSWRRRGQLTAELGPRPRTALLRLAVLVALYAVVVAVIHLAAN